MKFRVTLHRIVSWWLAIFSVLTIISGYAVARKWFGDAEQVKEMITSAHIILKWAFVVLMFYHIAYTFTFVNFKGIIIRNPKTHWIRLIQQITKWLILVFSFLIIITGFSHYTWTKPYLPEYLLERVHIVFDIGLTISILVHLMAGFKIMFKRKKIDKLFVDVLIQIVGIGLIAGAITLEVILLFK
ncbi:MAG: hypothetical protein ACTSSB_05190 [Candidatus Heimdallarchaeota archaeon]